jgi:hypothetical protein
MGVMVLLGVPVLVLIWIGLLGTLAAIVSLIQRRDWSSVFLLFAIAGITVSIAVTYT